MRVLASPAEVSGVGLDERSNEKRKTYFLFYDA